MCSSVGSCSDDDPVASETSMSSSAVRNDSLEVADFIVRVSRAFSSGSGDSEVGGVWFWVSDLGDSRWMDRNVCVC